MPNTSGRPNILFFFPDQLRFDWMGRNLNIPLRTPNLDRLEKNGVTFTKTLCPSPVCAPSRSCVATGLEYDNCPVQGNFDDLPLDFTTVYNRLQDSGYHTMGCGKFDLDKGSCMAPDKTSWGLDGKMNIAEWGFSDGVNNEGKFDGVRCGKDRPQGPYLQFLEERGLRQAHVDDFGKRGSMAAAFPTPLPDDAYCDNWIGNNGLELLKAAPDGKPWFLQVNFNGPHDPWDITESMKELYKGETFPLPNGNTEFSDEEHQEVRRNYSAMVENIDRNVGLYLDLLEERGELENTLIIFSSDHGEMLGDHNGWLKSIPWHESASVPLVISGPGVQKGVTCDLPMTNLDVTATSLDYAGLDIPEDIDSRSLKPLLEGKTDTHRDYVLSGLAEWRSSYDGRFKYIEGYQGTPQFYDHETDLNENNNLIKDPNAAADIERLKGYLMPRG